MKKNVLILFSICFLTYGCATTSSKTTDFLSNYFQIEETPLDSAIRVSSIGTLAKWEESPDLRTREAKFILYFYNTAEQDYFIHLTAASLRNSASALEFISAPMEIRLIPNSVERIILSGQTLPASTDSFELIVEFSTPSQENIKKTIIYTPLTNKTLRENKEIKRTLRKL
ncbi:MAG: hypothetical protein KC733_12080 [Candidatus Omnitrophica bacterium]|nr:hypothetical protein [Candidatus Omnitrophota bacterium]